MHPSRFNSEKRNFMRMSMNCPVSYQVLSDTSQKMGTCINLSASGILFECDNEYPIGTRIKINVLPMLEISPSFSAVLEVKRITSKENEASFRLAGTLEDIH